jgi:hypothetical protein
LPTWLGPIAALLTALASCLTCGLPAHAQSEPAAQLGEQREYQSSVEQALAEYDLQHFEEARTLFAKAHALAPSARTWRGLGMAEFELRNYPACITDLEQALVEPIKPLSGSLRSDTEALLARAREFVARVELSLRPARAPSTLLVDGAPVQLRDDGSLLLPVGEHVLELVVEGYVPEKRKLSLVSGRDEQLDIVLRQRSKEPTPDQPAEQKRRPVYKNPWLWTGVALAVIGATALGVGLALRKDAEPSTVNGSPEVGGGLIQTLRFGR